MHTKADTGWAWVVLLNGSLCYCLIIGMVSSYGIYFVTFSDYFQTSRQEAALVASVMYGLITGTGPISSLFYQWFGARETVMVGAIFTSAGYIFCYFANSIFALTGLHALIGFGLGLAFVAVLSVLNEYFVKHRHLALGCVSIGGGLGVFIFPPLFELFIQTFGWRGSMLINAGITLQMLVFGATMRPNERRSHKSMHEMCNFHLFTKPTLVLYVLSSMCWAATGNTYYQLTNALAISVGVPKHSTPWIVSVCGVADVVGRSSTSFINSLKCTNKFLFYSIAMAIMATAVFLNSFAQSTAAFYPIAALFGYGFGSMIASFAVATYQLFGLEHFSSAQGYAQLFSGIGGLTLPVLAAKLADEYGLRYAFYFAGGLGLSGVFCCAIILIISFINYRK